MDISVFDGLMLSDGCLEKSKSSKYPRYSQSCIYKEYLDFVYSYLCSLSVPFGTKYIDYYDQYISPFYRLRSRHKCDFLLEQYKRWYPEGIKIVPKDIVLSSMCVSHWYLGDGYIRQTKGYLKGTAFATDGFTEMDVKFLVDKLKELGISCRYTRAKNGIAINKQSIHYFFNYIGKCPLSCFQYKYTFEKYDASPPVYGSIEQRREIWKRHREKKKLEREKLGISLGKPGFLSINEEKVDKVKEWLLSLPQGKTEITREIVNCFSYGRKSSFKRGVKRLLDREQISFVSLQGNSIIVQ